jgi:hypothetical protein
MARLTLDAVGRTLLGASTVESAAAVAPALGVVQEYAIRTLYSPTPVWARGAARRLPTARARRYLAAVRTLDDVVGALVQERVGSAGRATTCSVSCWRPGRAPRWTCERCGTRS